MIDMQTAAVNLFNSALGYGIVAYLHGEVKIVVFPFAFAAIFQVLGVVITGQGIRARTGIISGRNAFIRVVSEECKVGVVIDL